MIILDESTIINNTDSTVIIGKFDGLHLGHQKLINQASDISKEKGLKSIMYTFSIPNAKTIYSYDDKVELISKMPVDKVYFQDFNDEFKKIMPEQFVYDILIKKFCAKHIVVGFNFKFGYKQSADVNVLEDLCRKYGISLTVVNEVEKDGKTVSSSLIRELILNSDMKNVKKYLGRNYFITERVLEGKKIGRKISFPTANFSAPDDIILPQNGVYYTKTTVEEKLYHSITNIGFNPTVSNNNKKTIETHIIDFDEQIYNQKIKVEFLQKIRNEMKFSSLNELKNQISKDKNFVYDKMK